MKLESKKSQLIIFNSKYGYYTLIDGKATDKEGKEKTNSLGAKIVFYFKDKDKIELIKKQFSETDKKYIVIKCDYDLSANVLEDGTLAKFPLKIFVTEIY